MPTAFVGVRISPDAKQRLEQLAESEGTSVNALLRGVIDARIDGVPDTVSIARGKAKNALADGVTSAEDLSVQLDLLRTLRSDIEREIEAHQQREPQPGFLELGEAAGTREWRDGVKALSAQLAACNRKMRTLRREALDADMTEEELEAAEAAEAHEGETAGSHK